MKTVVFAHDDALRHCVAPGHPERPDRYATVRALLDEEFPHLEQKEAPKCSDEDILLVHPESYLHRIVDASPDEGFSYLDADTVMSAGSLDAARRSAGAALAAVDAVMEGQADNVFVAMRPPGHHAEADKAMGFCFFSNAAMAARHARERHGAERVAVLDFDVHHGNGTQALFWDDKSLLLASTHQMPLYPGTGAADETGAGNIFNAPLKSGDGPKEMFEAWRSVLLPAINKLGPELILVSAGFDAHRLDPLANINMEAGDYGELTREFLGLADSRAGGRVVSLLEGGYSLEALRDSVRAHLRALEGKEETS